MTPCLVRSHAPFSSSASPPRPRSFRSGSSNLAVIYPALDSSSSPLPLTLQPVITLDLRLIVYLNWRYCFLMLIAVVSCLTGTGIWISIVVLRPDPLSFSVDRLSTHNTSVQHHLEVDYDFSLTAVNPNKVAGV
ncbi:hypothetical protein ZWY2020_057352 [Hordeum vulgare]|nr:hypothetical protein ZWY2020_057352 [Hordeum vulgare]